MEQWYNSALDSEENNKLKQIATKFLNSTTQNYTRKVVDISIYEDKYVGKFVGAMCAFYDQDGKMINDGELMGIYLGQYGILDLDNIERIYDKDKKVAYDVQALESDLNKQWISIMAFETSGKKVNGKTYLECVRQNYIDIINRYVEQEQKKLIQHQKSAEAKVYLCMDNIIDGILKTAQPEESEV